MCSSVYVGRRREQAHGVIRVTRASSRVCRPVGGLPSVQEGSLLRLIPLSDLLYLLPLRLFIRFLPLTAGEKLTFQHSETGVPAVSTASALALVLWRGRPPAAFQKMALRTLSAAIPT